MAGTVSQTQQTAFSTPVDGQAATATVVLSNDNTIRTKHNTHDADATIHVQSSVLASRPSASIAQRVWVTTDGLRAYVDSGTAWAEFAYLPLVGGTVAGTVTATAFVGPITGAVTGNVTGNVTGTLTGNVTGNVSGTAATVTTAAQPAITSLGTLTGLTVSGTSALQVTTVATINGYAVSLSSGPFGGAPDSFVGLSSTTLQRYNPAAMAAFLNGTSPHFIAPVVDSGGFTVSSGTTAVQALTATTVALTPSGATSNFYRPSYVTGTVASPAFDAGINYRLNSQALGAYETGIQFANSFTDSGRSWMNFFTSDASGTVHTSMSLDSDGRLNVGSALTGAFGDALRVRAATAASGTVQAVRSELHVTSGQTGSKYGEEVVVYAEHTSGTLQTTKAIAATVTQTGAGTTTNVAPFEANITITAPGTITNATGVNILAPSVSGGGAITNLTGLAIGNMAAGGTTNFAIKTGTGLVQFGDQLIVAASNGTRAGLRFAAGTTPADTTGGQLWYDGAGYYVMLGGSRYSINLTLAP